MISNYSGCGQTTVVVNLASGLARKGYRVLIDDLGHNEKLHNWLGISQSQYQSIVLHETTNNIKPKVLHSPLNMDLVNLVIIPGHSSESFGCLPALKKLDYDYLLLLPRSIEVRGRLVRTVL
jgi:cellulose biosynthesis protein BcsQ